MRHKAYVVTLSVAVLWTLAGQGWGSILVAPGAPSEDSSLSSNIVAVPLNPTALFQNSAQLAVLPRSFAVGLDDEYGPGVDLLLISETWDSPFGSRVIFQNPQRLGPTANRFFLGRSTEEWALFGIQLTRRLNL